VSAGPPRDRKLTIANLATAIGVPTFPPGSQAYDIYLTATTTNNTPTAMSPLVLIPAGSTIVFVAYIVGRQLVSGVSGAYKLEGSLRYTSEDGLSALSGVFRVAFGEDDEAWTVTFEADVINGALKILVTGAAADTVEWFAHVHVIEVTA
jgi:hypothetical protein